MSAFRHALLLLLLACAALCPRLALAAGKTDCTALADTAEKEQAHIVPVQSLRVTGTARLHFHRAPDESCATKVYVVPRDRLLAYAEWKGWLWVQYTHPETGTVSSGWIPEGRTEFVGTMGPNTSDAEPSPEAPKASLPKAVSDFVERVQMCEHFAGEFNGDQSEHDREVNKTMTELRCGALDADRASLRRKYRDQAQVLEALAEEP